MQVPITAVLYLHKTEKNEKNWRNIRDNFITELK